VYGYEALDLFEERARAVQPDFTLDTASRDVVAQLCQRLDGLPLAIELAAVRLRALSIEQIVVRLEDRYRLLKSGNRGGPARHQTLRATVDWSFDLCSEPEQALWARLSTFAGGFDLEAAEAVCVDDVIGSDDVFDLLAGLIDKSIVLRGEFRSQVSYRLLETIKAYGREKLSAAGAEENFRRRHRDYYLRLAEQSEDEWFGRHQVEWRDRLQNEQANLWAALEYCFAAPGESPAALHMAGALCFYWNACGHLKDGRYWLERALNSEKRPSADRTKALLRHCGSSATWP
jgi:predicted ATPase